MTRASSWSAAILAAVVSGAGLGAQGAQEPATRPGAGATTKPVVYASKPAWEEAVAAEARAFLATDVFRGQHPGEDPKDYELGGVTLIRHPRLEAALPRWRFYLAHVYSRHVRDQGSGSFEHYYVTMFFGRVDTKTGKAWFTDRGEATGNEAWRFDVVEFLKQQDLRVRDQADVERFDELYRVLCRVKGGGGAPVAKGTKQVPEALVERKLGLGSPVPRVPNRQELVPRVVVSKNRWHSVAGFARCDDWNMPVHMEFRWLSFDRGTGRFLGRFGGKGRTFASKDWSDEVRAAEEERFCKELAGKD